VHPVPCHPKRILVVDDHPIVRLGICQLVDSEADLEISGEADSVDAALRLVAQSESDLVVVDLSLLESSGLGLIRRLRESMPNLQVLVLSMHDEMHFAERSLRAGARGYIMKLEAITGLVRAIRVVLSGNIYVSERVTQVILERIASPEPLAAGLLRALSDRELEVFQLIGQGRSTADIAEHLAVSVKTVETYRANIRDKFNLRNAAELVWYATSWAEHF
jgi:DNA-binding NarL/FixJ family response regulator